MGLPIRGIDFKIALDLNISADGANVSIDDFELRAGEHVLLRGPNGCGKTSLLRVIAGTLAPDTGVVTLPPRVAALTAPVQLPSNLSSGQRQRGVAALLCEDADVYIADEPLANLDQTEPAHGGADPAAAAQVPNSRRRSACGVQH